MVVRAAGRVDRGGQHIGAHHHAGAAAGGRVVDRAVRADPVLADVLRLERPDARGERLARQARAERAREHLGIESENGGAEGHACQTGVPSSAS